MTCRAASFQSQRVLICFVVVVLHLQPQFVVLLCRRLLPSKSVYNLCLGHAHWFVLKAKKTPWVLFLDSWLLSLVFRLLSPISCLPSLVLLFPCTLGSSYWLAPFDSGTWQNPYHFVFRFCHFNCWTWLLVLLFAVSF